MHRCYVDFAVQPGETISLSPEESAHVARVLRMKSGDSVELIGDEGLYDGALDKVSEKETTVRVLCALPSPEPQTHITLYQGLPKADKLEMIVQKATELGVWRVVPVQMERCVVKLDGKKNSRTERLTRIATEAAKQSGRAHVPEITEPMTLAQAALDAQNRKLLLAPWEETRKPRLLEAVTAHLEMDDMGLIIGPEGGMTPTEMACWQAAGAIPVTLGSRILRTETAGLCCLSIMLSALGDLG